MHWPCACSGSAQFSFKPPPRPDREREVGGVRSPRPPPRVVRRRRSGLLPETSHSSEWPEIGTRPPEATCALSMHPADPISGTPAARPVLPGGLSAILRGGRPRRLGKGMPGEGTGNFSALLRYRKKPTWGNSVRSNPLPTPPPRMADRPPRSALDLARCLCKRKEAKVRRSFNPLAEACPNGSELRAPPSRGPPRKVGSATPREKSAPNQPLARGIGRGLPPQPPDLLEVPRGRKRAIPLRREPGRELPLRPDQGALQHVRHESLRPAGDVLERYAPGACLAPSPPASYQLILAQRVQ
jgi:hypothetical protein